MNCIDGGIEFTWYINAWTSSGWGQRRNVSSIYLSHIDGFCDVDLNAISLKYSMYTLANTGDNGNPIAQPYSYWYEVGCFYIESQHFHQIIDWDTSAFFQWGICG